MTNISWYNVSKLLFMLVSFSTSINFDVDSWQFHRFCCINCFHWEICIQFLWLHLLSFLYLCLLWTKLSNMSFFTWMSNNTFWRYKSMFECASHLRFHVQRILPNAHKGVWSQLMSTTCDQNLQTVSEFTRSYNIVNVLWVSFIGTDVNLRVV